MILNLATKPIIIFEGPGAEMPQRGALSRMRLEATTIGSSKFDGFWTESIKQRIAKLVRTINK